jgi:hypothetical protein
MYVVQREKTIMVWEDDVGEAVFFSGFVHTHLR